MQSMHMHAELKSFAVEKDAPCGSVAIGCGLDFTAQSVFISNLQYITLV